jgi:hypothetical protein
MNIHCEVNILLKVCLNSLREFILEQRVLSDKQRLTN